MNLNDVYAMFGSTYRIDFISVSKKGYPKIARNAIMKNQIIIKNSSDCCFGREFFLLTKM